MMEPEQTATALFLTEADKMAPDAPPTVMPALKVTTPTILDLISRLEAELQSLRHGLGVVQAKLTDLAELPGQWRDDAKESA